MDVNMCLKLAGGFQQNTALKNENIIFKLQI